MKRLFLIVLDSVGIGALPDAAAFGDAGANTMHRISESEKFRVPNLISLGLGNIEGLSYLGKTEYARAAYGRCAEMSMGKDTTVGHWEIAGLISEKPLPTYPEGFPEEVISAFSQAVGRGVLCNKPYSGTDVIRDYGEEHLATGDLIVYTSGDSVFQIAAHEDVVPTQDLYEYCKIARNILSGEHSVGRVIARPFAGEAGAFYRTADRRDFSLEPYGETLLDALSAAGLDVISVGKISDIFAGRGITEAVHSHGNEECMAASLELAERDFRGLCFINLVDFDMKYGHRSDVSGYAAALSRFDAWLPEFTSKLGEGDVLIITADHGCDPGDESTDHTREYTPLLVLGDGIDPTDLGTRASFADIAATAAEAFGVNARIAGKSFYKEITEGTV
jgi:phosphopentomutase